MTVQEMIDHLARFPRDAKLVVDVSANEYVDGEVTDSNWEGDRVVRGVDEVMTQRGTPFVHIMAAAFHAPTDCANAPWDPGTEN